MKNNDLVLAIDIGGTAVKFGIVDSCYRLLMATTIPTCAEQGAEAMISRIIEKAKLLRTEYPFSAVGIGTPGMVDYKNGICVRASNLPYQNTPMASMVSQALGCPVLLGNDGTCAITGELYAGYGKQYKDFVMITLGTGVGGGIVIDGKPYMGIRGGAGEIGHMILDYDGRLCHCGQRGCYEQYASVTALIRQTREAAKANPQSLLAQLCEDSITGKTAFDAASAGCPVAAAVIDRYTGYAAAGITSIMRIFQPEAVILGGAISEQGDNLLRPIRDKCVLPIDIKISELKNNAGLLGAAALIKET